MIDVESNLLDQAYTTSTGATFVKARFRVDLSRVPPERGTSSVPIAIWARVYDKAEVERRNSDSLKDCPVIAEGPEVCLDATERWTEIPLELPRMPVGQHVVVAKVTSRNPHFGVDNSSCYAGLVTYGISPVTISRQELDAIGGTNDPLAADEIRTLLERGLLVVRES